MRLSWRQDNFGGIETLEMDLNLDVRIPPNPGYRFLSRFFNSVDGYETDRYSKNFLMTKDPDWQDDFLRFEEEYGLEPLLDQKRGYKG